MTGQVGGDHYRVDKGPDHLEYCNVRNFDPYQYIITKWVERWRKKGGLEDLYKARHALERYIQFAEIEEANLQGKKAGVTEDMVRHEMMIRNAFNPDGWPPPNPKFTVPGEPDKDYVDQD